MAHLLLAIAGISDSQIGGPRRRNSSPRSAEHPTGSRSDPIGGMTLGCVPMTEATVDRPAPTPARPPPSSRPASSRTGSSSPATATGCSARRSRRRTPSRRRSSGRGAAYDRFEGRAAFRSWLYKIATNVCLDMKGASQRRARPIDLNRRRSPPTRRSGRRSPRATWIEPVPDERAVAVGRRSGRRRRRPRVDPAGVRRRAPAPAAEAARRADPARGPPLEGRGGRRAPRHERRVGEQRPPARPGDARDRRTSSRPIRRRPSSTTSTRRSSRAMSRRSSSTTWTR